MQSPNLISLAARVELERADLNPKEQRAYSKYLNTLQRRVIGLFGRHGFTGNMGQRIGKRFLIGTHIETADGQDLFVIYGDGETYEKAFALTLKNRANPTKLQRLFYCLTCNHLRQYPALVQYWESDVCPKCGTPILPKIFTARKKKSPSENSVKQTRRR